LRQKRFLVSEAKRQVEAPAIAAKEVSAVQLACGEIRRQKANMIDPAEIAPQVVKMGQCQSAERDGTNRYNGINTTSQVPKIKAPATTPNAK
jgi:hypothetical protein